MAKDSDSSSVKSGAPKDWTTKLPMVDLETSIKVITDIREKAIETASGKEMAQKLGYASATSTPFYRRMVAARLFGLMEGSALTPAAIDYIKPHVEGTKAVVLLAAVNAIPAYRELINKYAGKKLNVGLVANSIEKENNLTATCATVCAKAFESSLAFAGLIAGDGSVQAAQDATQATPSDSAISAPPAPAKPAESPKPSKNGAATPDTQEQSLFLDKDKERSFTFTGPLEISRTEFDRICRWLEFTMIIAEANGGEEGSMKK